MIFRDDDISHETNLPRFKQIHNLFVKYNVLHTVALICKDIDKNPELIAYINGNDFDVQVHCWEHVDYSKCDRDLIDYMIGKSVAIIEKYFHRKPTILFPPWNKSNDVVVASAAGYGLTVSTTKISISQYLRGYTGEVINFHSWSDECNQLEEALIKFTNENRNTNS